MKKKFKSLIRYINAIGINPSYFLKGIKNIFGYIKDYREIKKQCKINKDFNIYMNYPCLHDKNKNGGTAKGHYFHQDLLVARTIYKNKPIKHVDIGSRVDGFIAHLAIFREVEVFDIRKIDNQVENIIFKQADFINLDSKLINYCDSISSLHAIEHFGLGRYGDPIDINGHLKGLDNIHKILKKGGTFYFSVPIGKQRIEFNGHRVFSIKYLVELFKNKYKIQEFSYIDDKGDLNENIEISEGIKNNFGCNYGCGIFTFIKI